MSGIAICCFLVSAGILASYLRRGSDRFSPGRLFGLIWSIAFGLSELKLSGLQHEWPAEAWIQLLLGPLSFLAGIFIIHMMSMSYPLKSIEQIRTRSFLGPVDHRKLFGLILLSFVLFVVGYAGILALGGEIPLLSTHPSAARLKFQIFGLGLFLHNVVIIVFFTAMYHIIVAGEARKKLVLAITSMTSVAMYAVTLQRFQIVMSVMLSIILLYYLTHTVRFSTISALLLAGGLFSYWVLTARGGQLIVHYLYVDAQMRISPTFAALTEPYMYVVMNLENFARALVKLDHFTYGYYTFDFVTALSGIKHWLGSYFAINDTPYLTSGFNTYTAFWWFYRDFGSVGISVIPLVLGLAVGIVYYRMRSTPSLGSISSYAVCVFIMLFSFYANFVSLLWFFYNLLTMALFLRLIRPRGEPVPPGA